MTRCIIIEDEDHAALYLSKQLKACDPSIEIQAILDTVEDAVAWLSKEQTDIIFSDIQLGDGLSFEIFDHIQNQTPIVFTTSFDKYAIKAFEQNSIAYLLKPVKQSELTKALTKFRNLYDEHSSISNMIAQLNPAYQDKFMIRSGNAFQTLRASDIAYFRLQDKRYLFIVTRTNQQFMYDSSLELLESRLNPAMYFRINRQIIVNKDAIQQAIQVDRGRFQLVIEPKTKDELVVSIGRAKAFRDWLDS